MGKKARAKQAERWPGEGERVATPFPLPKLPLGLLRSPISFFFFLPTSIFSPFFPNAEPGPRLMLDEPQLDAHPRRPRGN